MYRFPRLPWAWGSLGDLWTAVLEQFPDPLGLPALPPAGPTPWIHSYFPSVGCAALRECAKPYFPPAALDSSLIAHAIGHASVTIAAADSSAAADSIAVAATIPAAQSAHSVHV